MKPGKVFKIGILTVSDKCSQGVSIDKSGEVIENEIKSGAYGNAEVTVRACVSDDIHVIKTHLCLWSDSGQVDAIITTGGTGFAPRDVTPEATKNVIDKEAAGMSQALIAGSLQITPYAMLSRLVCGIRKKTLIINLPGSPKACTECLHILKPVISHAIYLIKNDQEANEQHKNIPVNQPVKKGCRGCHNKVRSQVDITKVARRHRVSPHPMILVKEAQNIILKTISRQPSITIDLQNALGYVLDSDIRSKESFPPFPASMKDGYAVIASDGAGKRTVLSGTVAGDQILKEIIPGECVRITTGAPLPLGADAVVQVEDTKLLSESEDGKVETEIEILKAPHVGLDIREVGSDIEENSIVLKSGTLLGYAELGILATVGACTVPVISRPKIGILSTGNEIQPPEEEPSYGKIRDSNKTTLLALLKENGFEAMDCGIVVDDPTEVLKKIQATPLDVDVLITTGGVSMGEMDVLTDVLVTDFKATLHFGRINMKPGKPTKFFSLTYSNRTKYVFALPGNPVSAAVTCHLFVLPALKAMSGVNNPFSTVIKVKLSFDVDLDDRYEYARAILNWKEDDPVPWASLTGNQVSCRMLSMVSAKCLLKLPAATESLRSLKIGDIVDAEIIGRL